jgi:hypothetical protein
MKMGKRNGKRKRERIFQLAGPGGISAHQARARARGRACDPAGPAVRGDDVVARARTPERGRG